MSEIITRYLDIEPANMPFTIQSTKSDGTVINPTVDTLVIYEKDGTDANEIVVADEIGNSPFDPVNIPTDGVLTGFWQIMIAKVNFTAGRYYIFRWQFTVDGIITAKTETYFMTNTSNFKANVTNLDAAVSSRAASGEYDTEMNRIDVAVSSRSIPSDIINAHSATDGKIDVVDSNVDSIKSTVDNVTYGLSALKTLIDLIDTSTELAARFTEIKGAGWTDETLKAIKALVEAISIENFTVKAGSKP